MALIPGGESHLRDNRRMLADTLDPTLSLHALPWQHRFAALGPAFHTRLAPTPLPAPYWVGRSRRVADLLGLAPAWSDDDAALAALTGNVELPGSDPMATVYSGHQFGVWAGQLGDGRALLLGETASGHEIQLKGAGRTPYSRMGDGRAVLRSSIREFLCSEAMHGLGIPTTRALCVTGSNAPIRRERIETAAVVTRVAPSFIRFGHFEHFAANGQFTELRQLADFVIDRFYPACRTDERFAGNPYAALLEAVSARTARLLAQWQAVGFCHGVMNTDNMSILGLTLDYGPFQFLDGYDPSHICNHSDTEGRYAFARQPQIAHWNLFCLGQALLPLIEDQAHALAALEPYAQNFSRELLGQLGIKLGLSDARDEDRPLIDSLLQLLARERVDYTLFWRRLSHHVAGHSDDEPVHALFHDGPAFAGWLGRYEQRLGHEHAGASPARMLAVNPKFVLRNHLGELAIRQAGEGDFSGVSQLLGLLEDPCAEHPGHEREAGFPPDWASSIEISCSS